MTVREELIELINKLFIFTDDKNWSALKKTVFANEVYLDMSSAGGSEGTLTSDQICEMWQGGLGTLDAVNHLTGNFLVDIVNENFAKVFCYATATHYNASAKNGITREFVGSYNFEVIKQDNNWKITSFIYNLKYMNGNMDLS